MKKWEVYLNSIRQKGSIYGETLAQAIQENAKYLANINKKDSEIILSVTSVKFEWSDGIMGAKGGVKAYIGCRCSSAYTENSPKYQEFDKIFEAWIIADKADL